VQNHRYLSLNCNSPNPAVAGRAVAAESHRPVRIEA
jgi:hypothetical protein